MPDILDLPPKQPTSKLRKFLIVLILLLLIMLGFMIYLYNQASKAGSYMQTAFNNYNQGLENVNNLVTALSEEDYLKLSRKKQLNLLKSQIETATKRFSKANHYFNLLSKIALTDWEITISRYAKKAVRFNLQGLKQADKWLTSLQAEQAKIKLANQGSENILKAFNLANEATSLINKRQYETAKLKLTAATSATVEGELNWQQLAALTKDKRADEIIAGIGKMKEWLQLLQSINVASSQKNIALYSSLKQDKILLDDDVVNLTRNENLLNLKLWVDENLTKESSKSTAFFSKAEKQKTNAIKLWEKYF